ncbi:hypothetical protein TNCV_1196311 [Trichonephila clavipes]|uniref:Uncharacterized protein n=1 Tax=Trichonephila clavipes TaxID=2585209 RepID=A0A8X6RZZ0_TRICX|nr:hypothetical protein TNCV_1196311 [Trichonephila clavipes]
MRRTLRYTARLVAQRYRQLLQYDYAARKRSLESFFNLGALYKIKFLVRFCILRAQVPSLGIKLDVKITCSDWYITYMVPKRYQLLGSVLCQWLVIVGRTGLPKQSILVDKKTLNIACYMWLFIVLLECVTDEVKIREIISGSKTSAIQSRR